MSEKLSVVRNLQGEILGPESAFAISRLERKKEWQPIVESAKNLNVVDHESKELAVAHGRLLQASGKEVAELYKTTKQLIDAIKKPILTAEKEDIGAIDAAKDLLGAKVHAWNKEQERIQQEELRKAREEARKAEEERRLAEAIAAEAYGDKEEADAILNEPELPLPVMVQNRTVKTAGEVETTRYTAIVTDLRKLVIAVAKGAVPLQAVMPNQPFLNDMAKDFRQGLAYDGVTVESKTTTHFRS